MNKRVSVETNDLKVNYLVEGFREGRFKIPRYQRGYVWDEQMTTNLLDSILKGYPMGSILTWEQMEDKGSVSYVIDGQQRTQTLMRIISNPMKFQNRETLELICGFSIKPALEKALIEKMKDLKIADLKLEDDLNDKQKMTSNLYKLSYSAYMETYSSKSEAKVSEFALLFTSKFSSFTRYITSDQLMLPVTKVSNADEDQIIEIFNVINTTGEPLTNFEILASKWSKHKISLTKKHKDIVDKLYESNVIDDVKTRDDINTPAELFYSIINLSLRDTDHLIKLFNTKERKNEVSFEHMEKFLWLLRIWVFNKTNNIDNIDNPVELNDFLFDDEYDITLGEKLSDIYKTNPVTIDEFVSELKYVWDMMETRMPIIETLVNNSSIRNSLSKNMFISAATQMLCEKMNFKKKTYEPREDIQLFIVKEILERGFSKATTSKMKKDITSLTYINSDINIDQIRTLINDLNHMQSKETNFNDGFESMIKFVIAFAFKGYTIGASVEFDYDHIFPKSVLIEEGINKNINVIGNCGLLESRINRNEKRAKLIKEECLSDRLIKISDNKLTREKYEVVIDIFNEKGAAAQDELFEFMEERYDIIIEKFLEQINPVKYDN